MSAHVSDKVLAGFADHLEECYPPDVFIPITDEQVARVHLAFAMSGVTVDAWSAHLMRHAAQLARSIASDTDAVTIPRPRIPYGPHGIDPDVADADYLRKAADDLETHYKPFGSHVRATVVKLLRDAADAIRAGS